MASPSQIGVVQTAQGHTVVGSTLSSASFSSTTGNLIVVAISNAQTGNPVTSVKNAAGVSFTQIGTPADNGSSALQMLYLNNITGNASEIIKATWGSAPLHPIIFVWEVQNADPNATVSVSSKGTGAGSTNASSFNITSDCLVLAAGSGFTTTATYIDSATSAGVIFDNATLSSDAGGVTMCGGHTAFSGHNNSVVMGFNPQDGTAQCIIVAAFTAAIGMGVKLNIVCQGDSITSGLGVTTPYTGLLALNKTSQVYNLGLASETLATMVSNAPTLVDPKIRANMTNFVVIWAGTNDFVLNGSTPATVEGLLVTYATNRFSAGWNFVISVQMLDRTDANVNADKHAYNAFMTGPPIASPLSAVTIMPATLTADGAAANLTYFQNAGVHPNQFSFTTIIAPDISATINSLIPVSGGGGFGKGDDLKGSFSLGFHF